MKSLFAGLAALIFAYNCFFFIASPFAYYNPGSPSGIDGDAGAVAISWAVRAICGGLAILALAFIDWSAVRRALSVIGPPAAGSEPDAPSPGSSSTD